MIRVTCLASGSSGNSLLIQHDERALLIDAGMTAKALTTCLTERGVGLGSLDGVLITHEHGDHIRGADVLARRFGAPLIANRATLAALGRPGRGYEQRARRRLWARHRPFRGVFVPREPRCG
ncbi:MAG: MBL fold metallo-hydrolase [Chloroflexia bacterium]